MMTPFANEYHLIWSVEQPVTGVDRRHLEAFIDRLRAYYEEHKDTGGLPSALGYLDMLREAVFPMRQHKEGA